MEVSSVFDICTCFVFTLWPLWGISKLISEVSQKTDHFDNAALPIKSAICANIKYSRFLYCMFKWKVAKLISNKCAETGCQHPEIEI